MVCDNLTLAKTDTNHQLNRRKGIYLYCLSGEGRSGQGSQCLPLSTTMGFGGDLKKMMVGIRPQGDNLGLRTLITTETQDWAQKADKWFQKGEGRHRRQVTVEPLTVSKDGETGGCYYCFGYYQSRFPAGLVNNAYNVYKATPAADAETGATKQEKRRNKL